MELLTCDCNGSTKNMFPLELVSPCLFFGNGGYGPQWAFKRDLPGTIIRLDAELRSKFEIVGDSQVDVWREEKEMYETLESEM